MDAIFSFNTLLIVNLSLLGALFLYLLTKIKAHPSVGYLVASLTPLIGFQLGCYLFTNRPTSPEGATADRARRCPHPACCHAREPYAGARGAQRSIDWLDCVLWPADRLADSRDPRSFRRRNH